MNPVPKLKKIYLEKEITTCELRLPGCKNNMYLGFAHRHKRRWYKLKPSLLADFNQTVLACQPCHEKIEYNKKLTATVFNQLRGEENGT
jgi:hypothetical protein